MSYVSNAVALILILFIISAAMLQNTGNVKIEITGLRNAKGSIRVGVYKKEKDFLKDAGVILRLTGKIENNKCLLISEPLPYGEYAFALLHDENDNGEMDYNWIKIPKEGFGFSNNPAVVLNAPSYIETKIRLNSAEQKIVIKAKYM